jgi:hypothetical protein
MRNVGVVTNGDPVLDNVAVSDYAFTNYGFAAVDGKLSLNDMNMNGAKLIDQMTARFFPPPAQ